MSHRPAMVAAEIRKLVASFVLEIPPDVCAFASITEVEVSSDLSFATVYVSAFEHSKAAVAFLKEHKAELKRRLSRVAYGYKIPDLRFVIDERSERGGRIDKILAEAFVEETEESSAVASKAMADEEDSDETEEKDERVEGRGGKRE